MIRRLISTETKKDAEALLPSVQSAIDRLVQDKIIHKNTASRYKRKLYHHLASLP